MFRSNNLPRLSSSCSDDRAGHVLTLLLSNHQIRVLYPCSPCSVSPLVNHQNLPLLVSAPTNLPQTDSYHKKKVEYLETELESRTNAMLDDRRWVVACCLVKKQQGTSIDCRPR